MEKVIFLGNGPLAEYALAVLKSKCQVIFHARTKADLEIAKKMKTAHPEAHGVLASFGVVIKKDLLDLFEPEGILNIHPSKLPLLRGASPIESAILAGETSFSVSVMKLATELDAGPIYYQKTLDNLPIDKLKIYQALAETGAEWIAANLTALPEPLKQDENKATFCSKLTKPMGILTPETDNAETTLRKIVALQGFPKPKYKFFGLSCIILKAHITEPEEKPALIIPCADGHSVTVEELQPEGRKAMDAESFLNGYAK